MSNDNVSITLTGQVEHLVRDEESGNLSFSLVHSSPPPKDDEFAEVRTSTFQVVMRGQAARHFLETEPTDGTPVIVTAYRMEECAGVFMNEDGEEQGAVWLRLYANHAVPTGLGVRSFVTGAVNGRVGKKPELRYVVGKGTPWASFSLAVGHAEWDKTLKDGQGDWLNTTIWTRVAIFSANSAEYQNDRAENAADKINTGDTLTVAITELHANAWVDQQGGLRLSVDLTAGQFQIVKAKPQAVQAAPPATMQRTPVANQQAAMAAAAMARKPQPAAAAVPAAAPVRDGVVSDGAIPF